MKAKIIFLLLFLCGFNVFSQGFKGKKEKVKALKIAYITSEIKLTTEEAQKFWPIYNTFDDKQFELRHEKLRPILDKFDAESNENLTEKEAASLLVQMESIEESMFQLRKKFIKDLQGVLSSVKIIKLKIAEEEFNRHLLKQIREKRRDKF